MADGGEASFPLRQVQDRQVVAAVPWRKVRSARGQAHYPGYFWSATMGGHVIYESRLELARLLLADFDRDVAAIAAQPFLLAHADGSAADHPRRAARPPRRVQPGRLRAAPSAPVRLGTPAGSLTRRLTLGPCG
jgi:hypothetical protein